MCVSNFMNKLHILTMESTCCWRLLFLIFLSAYTDHVFCLVFCFLLYCFIIRQVMQLYQPLLKKLDCRNMLMNVNCTIFVIDTNICQHCFIINLSKILQIVLSNLKKNNNLTILLILWLYGEWFADICLCRFINNSLTVSVGCTISRLYLLTN